MTKQEYQAMLADIIEKFPSEETPHPAKVMCKYIASLEAEIAQLQADNRSLVEQMNQMALKPNQAIIERHEYDHDNPETYPPKRRSYLCGTIAGFIELCWNPIGQEWHLVSEANIIYNHFQINAYYTWAYLPKGDTNE